MTRPPRRRVWAGLVVAAVLIGGCTGTPTSGPTSTPLTPGGSAVPASTPGSGGSSAPTSNSRSSAGPSASSSAAGTTTSSSATSSRPTSGPATSSQPRNTNSTDFGTSSKMTATGTSNAGTRGQGDAAAVLKAVTGYHRVAGEAYLDPAGQKNWKPALLKYVASPLLDSLLQTINGLAAKKFKQNRLQQYPYSRVISIDSNHARVADCVDARGAKIVNAEGSAISKPVTAPPSIVILDVYLYPGDTWLVSEAHDADPIQRC